MSSHDANRTIVSHHNLGVRSRAAYTTGFISSITLTLLAFGLVTLHKNHSASYSRAAIIGAIVTLAIAQFFIQMFCFLHLGRETRPRWKLLVFGFMIATVLTIVIGSLWIMSNLNYHMTQHQLDQYLQSQDGL